MHLVCKPSTVLEIQAADFGGSAAIICGNSEESYQLCKLMDKTDTVKSRCDGKPQCYISALRSIFGNPCLGLNKLARTSIYLNVIYACGKLALTFFRKNLRASLYHWQYPKNNIANSAQFLISGSILQMEQFSIECC